MTREKMNEIRKALRDGKEVSLECINNARYKALDYQYNKEVLNGGELKVERMGKSGTVILSNGKLITDDEMRLFSIKK